MWLVGTGGVLFVAFPRVLAAAFPAYYLALFLVLWTLILRGISLEFRGHIPYPMWRSFWDFVFAVSNTTLAVLFGTALGNVIRGMPLAPRTPLSLPLFTDFGVRENVGILNWYRLSVAVFASVALSAHGASYLALKTEGELHRRSAEAGGCALIAGLLGTAAASLFPVMLHSTLGAQYPITAFNGSSDVSSLRTAVYWWPIAFAFTLTYFSFIGEHYAGRVQLSKDTQRSYNESR